MTTLKVSNYLLSTKLPIEKAEEKFKELLVSYLDEMDADCIFNFDYFIEDLDEGHNGFEIIGDDENSKSIDIELSEDDIDEIVEENMTEFYDNEELEEDLSKYKMAYEDEEEEQY